MYLENLHPLVVHLPIGIAFMGFLMELWRLKYPNKIGKDVLLFVLANAAFFSLIAVATGWFLANNGGYDENNLNKHKWLGIAFATTTVLLFFLKKSKTVLSGKIYFPLFLVALLLLTLTGHYGGNMTHGEGFLFTDQASNTIEIGNIGEAKVFTQVIQPIFETKCVSCHNQRKSKGGLVLTNPIGFLSGSDSGDLFDTIAEHNANLLMHRVYLPLEDKAHMPPKGKQQLTKEEILLLDWWTRNNNCFECKVGNLQTEAKIESILAGLETDNSIRGKLARQLEFVSEANLNTLRMNKIRVQQIAGDNPLLLVNFSRRKNIKEADFKLLESVSENVVELNLANTNFNDGLSNQLKKFKNLTKLQLQGTGISSKTFESLKKLTALESLNLFGMIGFTGHFNDLATLPNLKNIYFSPGAIDHEIQQKFEQSGVYIHGLDMAEKFKASKLNAPVIIADTEIFNDSLLISISSTFEDAQTVYMYEENPGDTIIKAYKEPFYIKESITLFAEAQKEGWGNSERSKAIFLKTGTKIAKVSLARTPHKKYTAQRAKTLIDKKRGTTNFVDGKWLGYEAKNLVATFNLQEPTKVKTVSVGHLSAPASWIFSPVGYRIWGATNGDNYRLLKSLVLPPNKASAEVEKKLVNIDIEATELISVRVQVINQGKNPDWHPVPGGDSFIFIDEVVLN